MDCSLQYTGSGACPEEEIRERRAGVGTVPRASMLQPWIGIRVDTVGCALVLRTASFLTFWRTPVMVCAG